VNVAELLYPNFNSAKNVVDMIQVFITSAAVDYSTNYDVQNCHIYLGDKSWTVQLGKILQPYASTASSNKATKNNHTTQLEYLPQSMKSYYCIMVAFFFSFGSIAQFGPWLPP
jgi:hypothetical protein